VSNNRELLIALSPGEARWALREAGRVVELGVERERAGPRSGEIVLARVRAVVPSANAAFLDLGGGQEGFLSGRDARHKLAPGFTAAASPETDDIASLVNEGEALLVQIKRQAIGDKAAQVTAALALAGWRVVLTPGHAGIRLSRRITDAAERERLTELARDLAGGHDGEEAGLILRTAAAGADTDALTGEANSLTARWGSLREAAAGAKAPAAVETAPTPLAAVLRDRADLQPTRIQLDGRAGLAEAQAWLSAIEPGLTERAEAAMGKRPLFEAEGIDDEFDAAFAAEVALPGGGSLVIEPTAALVAVDVNTGGRTGKQGRAILETNLAAAKAVARQIRLRNLAGLIAVDFLRMRSANERDRVLAALRAALAKTVPDAETGGFTRFGLVEIVRPRSRPALHEALGEAVPGAGWRASAETVALAALRSALRVAADAPGRPLRLRAAHDVIAALRSTLKPAHGALEATLGLAVEMIGDPALGREDFDILPA